MTVQRASKESARDAHDALGRIKAKVDAMLAACKAAEEAMRNNASRFHDDHGRPCKSLQIVRTAGLPQGLYGDLEMVHAFLAAAERKLPSDKAYEKDLEGRVNAKIQAVAKSLQNKVAFVRRSTKGKLLALPLALVGLLLSGCGGGRDYRAERPPWYYEPSKEAVRTPWGLVSAEDAEVLRRGRK